MVSGVGGQFNFVAQAHELPGGRSIIAVRATRASGGRARIEHPLELRPRDDPAPPARHRADASTASPTSAARAMPRSRPRCSTSPTRASSRRSLADAQRAGKLPRVFRIPGRASPNLPEALERALAPHRAAGRFGALPYGTDLSPEEIRLGGALRRLKARSETSAGKLRIGAELLRPLAARCRKPRGVRAHGACRAAGPARTAVSPSRRGGDEIVPRQPPEAASSRSIIDSASAR